MSWREYLDAEVTKAPIRVTAGANSFCLNFDYRDAQPILGPTMNDVERFFHALQTYLRECCSLSPTAGSDEKAKAVDAPSPKQLPLKSADVLEEDETFDMQLEHYDPSKCPRCGTQIPANEKKCPLCGRKKLPELVTPYNIGNIEWFQKNTQFGNAKATGTLTIHDDRIEFRKTSGSTLESVIPGYNIYATIRANLEPREIFQIRDIAAVRKSSHGFNRPAFVITMKSGATHTFAANKTQASQDLIAGAVTLLEMLIRR